MEKQLNEIDGERKTTGWVWRGWVGGRWRVVGSDCLSIPVCVPPGGTNVSFEQFVDSPLSSWPAPIQTGSIFWTLGMPRASRGHQCVIQMPRLRSHHFLLCSCVSGWVFCTRAHLRRRHLSLIVISRWKYDLYLPDFWAHLCRLRRLFLKS